ncbi:MAG TPA: fused MFS/spermidine synthase [Thermodesulfobacteriota bacterium]|nr:fused MFS/spermidine synthase [Deltaproteobacteria bacterium]HOC37935.1 fused MFS/spermidine synthase [Thermodesulfobacteriota bacterium]
MRELLVVFVGNELCIGLIFSIWFCAIFFGSLIGGRLAERSARPAFVFLLVQLSLVVVPFFQILLIRNLRVILHIIPGESISFAVMVAAVAIALPAFCVLMGLVFPFGAAAYAIVRPDASQAVTTLYVWEALGSMAAGAVMTFYLLSRFSHSEILAAVGGLQLVTSLVLCRSCVRKTDRVVLAGVVLFLAGVGAAAAGFNGWDRFEAKTVQQRWVTINPTMLLIESIDSRYQNISVASLAGQYSIYGNGEHLTSFPDPAQAALSAHLFLSQHPAPDSVLLIGGGSDGIIGEMLKHPVAVLDYVELDPSLVSVARKYGSEEDRKVLDDVRVRMFARDGRYHVKTTKCRYDVVVVNVADPSTALLNRFYTADFYREVKAILKPGGLLTTRVSGAENYLGPELRQYVSSVYQSLSSVYCCVFAVPGDTITFFASDRNGIASSDPSALAQRFRERHIQSEFFSDVYFSMLLESERLKDINQELKNSSVPHLNTDLRPATYFYNLLLWDRFSSNTNMTFLRVINSLSRVQVGIFLGLVFLIGLYYIQTQKPESWYPRLRFVGLAAVFTTGLAAMGLEVILLFSFQNFYGYVYQYLGVLVASFMVGLAGGAVIMKMLMKCSFLFVPDGSDQPRTGVWPLLAVESAIILLCLLVPAVLRSIHLLSGYGGSGHGLPGTEQFGLFTFLMLVLAVGVVTGLEFPLVLGLLMQDVKRSGSVSGLAIGFDYAGAALGAALTGSLLVPLMGIDQSCWALAVLNGLSLLFGGAFLFRNR